MHNYIQKFFKWLGALQSNEDLLQNSWPSKVHVHFQNGILTWFVHSHWPQSKTYPIVTIDYFTKWVKAEFLAIVTGKMSAFTFQMISMFESNILCWEGEKITLKLHLYPLSFLTFGLKMSNLNGWDWCNNQTYPHFFIFISNIIVRALSYM